ncbi:hypothetical protein AAK967_00115 [Atopobiaceae bacterium 24-176]
MQINEVVRALLDHSGKSARSISIALGKADNWARLTARNSQNPKLGTIANVADLAGCDIAIVDRATGETIATIDPPKRGED